MSTGGIDEKYLDGLKAGELLLKLTWDEWLAIAPPYSDGKFAAADATVRYQRNGYDWDMHGTLYTPEKETGPRRACFFTVARRARKLWTSLPMAGQDWLAFWRRKASKSWR